jgi:predicted dinucleotide-binding enzyme
VIARSDIIILCVPHTAYKGLSLPGKIVVDIWNFWGEMKPAEPPWTAWAETKPAATLVSSSR